MSKSRKISMRLDEQDSAAIEKLAKLQDICPSAYLRKIISCHLVAIGEYKFVGSSVLQENGETVHILTDSLLKRVLELAEERTDSSTEKEEEKEKRDIPPAPPIESKEKREEKEISLTRVREMFDEFWEAFPGLRKVNKKKTAEKFRKIIEKAEKPEEFFRSLMIALDEKWKNSYLWQSDDGIYICAPIVWLNQERWNDEPVSAIGIANRSKPSNWLGTDRKDIQEVF